MNVQERIEVFSQLGQKLKNLSPDDFNRLAESAYLQNPWFTTPHTTSAISGIIPWLQKETLDEWCSRYTFNNVSKKVGAVMAGNIPLAGFHDFLCVLISGHQLMMKPSSNDAILLKKIISLLNEISPVLASRAVQTERMNEAEALIATGNDNTAAHFDFYFKNIPRLIRKNRSSAAVIMGEEPREEWRLLGIDIFTYFGLGCRNVSKLFIPEKHNIKKSAEAWSDFAAMIHHHKYANNYDYQRAILLLNNIPFHDNGYVLLIESPQLASPVSTLHYETYSSMDHLNEKIESHKGRLQCLVSAKGWYPKSVPFGRAQYPQIDDYADGVDTMKFLTSL